jgi:hypothetical protein
LSDIDRNKGDSFVRWLEFPNDEIRWQFLKYVSKRLTNCTLLSILSGYFGETFGHIERDDTMALLAGSDWLVILRQEGENWRYIGSAYVQAIMNWPPDTNINDIETLVLV